MIQNSLGLISAEQFIQIADAYIRENETIPDWVIKISLGESLNEESSLDLTLDPINEDDCKKVARELLTLYKKAEIDARKISEVSQKLYLSIKWGCETFDRLLWLSDEIDLIEEGYKSHRELNLTIEEGLLKLIG